MSDRRFDYDQELLQCCAQSRVVLLLQLHMQLVVESSDHANREVLHVVNPVSDKGFASPIINNNDDDDDDNPAGGEESQNSASSPSCCLELFDQHSRHYGRQHTVAESFFVDHDDDGFELGNRIEAFLRSVHFVYQHNTYPRVQTIIDAMSLFVHTTPGTRMTSSNSTMLGDNVGSTQQMCRILG